MNAFIFLKHRFKSNYGDPTGMWMNVCDKMLRQTLYTAEKYVQSGRGEKQRSGK
jgi:hypothetical protein